MKKEIITETDPKSPVSEIFRALRTNLQYMKRKSGCQTILYTSTIQGEGKSFVALNTAVTFAQAGKNVLIIDADMRRPRQHKVFETIQYPGLSNYLSGVDPDDNFKKIKLDECIKKTTVDKLYIMPAGVIPPNPSELLETPKLPRLIEKLEQVFDIVIIDGAPCLLVTDSTILSRYADSTVLVVASGKARIDDLKEAKARIQHVGGNLVGIVLNRVRTTKSKYESKYYYASNDKTTKSSKSSSYNRATHRNGMKRPTKEKVVAEVEEEDDYVYASKPMNRDFDSRNKEDRKIKKLGFDDDDDIKTKSEKTLKKEISKIKDFEIDEKTESDIVRGLGGSRSSFDEGTRQRVPEPETMIEEENNVTPVVEKREEGKKKSKSKYNFDDLDTATSNIEKAANEMEDSIEIPLFSKANMKKSRGSRFAENESNNKASVDEVVSKNSKEVFEEEDKEDNILEEDNDIKSSKSNEFDKDSKNKKDKFDKDSSKEFNNRRAKGADDNEYQPPLENEKDKQKIDDILNKINRYK